MSNTLQKQSSEWFQKQIKPYRKKEDRDEDYTKMNRRSIKPGNFITFKYTNPITPLKRLKFYDANPVDVILDIRGNDMLCLNFHYAPRVFRKSIIKFILKINQYRIKKDIRMKLTYQEMKEYIKRNGLEIMIKRYKINRIQNLQYVKPDDIKYVAELPSEKFVFDGKFSEDELQAIIRGHARKSKGAKNTRFGRKVKR